MSALPVSWSTSDVANACNWLGIFCENDTYITRLFVLFPSFVRLIFD